jgi:hypothetical protein
MNPVAEALIAAVVSEWTDASFPFTAFQVSKEVQRRLKSQGQPFVRHNDMKNEIHKCQQLADASEFGDYTQTLVPVAGTQAFLYHPTSFDASTWTPTTDVPTSIGTPAVSVAPLAAAVSSIAGALTAAPASTDDDDEGDDGSFVTDYRGRLMVPVQYLRNLGLKATDTVYVNSNVNEVTLCASTPSGSVSKARTVERNGDLRVLTTELQASGLSGNKFNIEMADVNGTKVVSIKAA